MTKARIRTPFDLSFPTNSPFQNRSSPIGRPSLRFSQAEASPHRFRRIQIAFRAEKSFGSPHEDDFSHAEVVVPAGGKSVSDATLVGVATLTSKILGFLREVTMASVFGVGAVATAFKYAWVLPGFSSSLLGGVNGPIHIIMSTTLSGSMQVGGVVGALVYIFPEFVIQIYAPGLWILAEGQIIREIAIKQLKNMTPCIVLAGPVGLGFGYMSAQGNNALPCISPALSSSLVIASCLISALTRGLDASSTGASLISYAVSIGLFFQWIIQVIMLRRRWFGITPDALNNILKSVDVCQFFSLLLPATVSSGLAQIASFTDLFFASLIPGAAVSLSYAYLMVMAPLGALSSIIVLPLVPKFSKLVKMSSWESLADDLERGLLLCLVLLLPIFSVMRSLAEPIIHILFERCAFDSSASALVSSLFLAYSLGTPFFIAKDLLVAVFYALGDGNQPFLVSAGAVALNAILDWLSVSRFNLGAKGLALSTSLTAALSVLILFHLLKRKLSGIIHNSFNVHSNYTYDYGANVSGLSSYAAMIYPTTLLLICCITSNITTSAAYNLMRVSLASTLLPRYNLMIELFTLSVAGALGLIGFFVPAALLHLSGSKLARDLYRMANG
ncbi:uncharacterized protein LOC131008678 isoform X2 [Salvia miltiorrhiza]|uniref:uncharacterized protein LOC131008678 isoform X2 n=1 Tax=Salvia miltiorrhiza TaxID=226208 RepID=UPI0025ACC0A0|nr:uncharacterized protein LOC131008678 isoform X2 [Salvia miltiorrhiza]